MPADERRYMSFSAYDASPTESQYLGVVAKYSVGKFGSGFDPCITAVNQAVWPITDTESNDWA